MPTYFDIETVAYPVEEIKKVMPKFSVPGNYSKQESIDNYIANKELEYIRQAPLDPRISSMAVLAYREATSEGIKCMAVGGAGDEAEMLTRFWDIVAKDFEFGIPVIGFYIKGFDLPYLVKRSWIQGVAIPRCVFGRNIEYFNDKFIDISKVFSPTGKDHVSLERMGNLFGFGGKSGKGEDFGKVWKTNKAAAMQYCIDDVQLTIKCAERMKPAGGW